MPTQAFQPDRDFTWLLVALALPLCAALLGYLFGRRLPGGGALATAAVGASAVIGVMLFTRALDDSTGAAFRHFSWDAGVGWNWLSRASASVSGTTGAFGLLYDGLAAAMFAVVAGVGFLVHLFSTGYMAHDPRRHVYFANLALFTAAMLALVVSDNLLSLFLCWELMGFTSYLLIGHYAHDPSSPRREHAARAATKAFLTTRVGDVCLLIALGLLYAHYGTLRMSELWRVVGEELLRNGGDFPAWLDLAGVLIVAGVAGKSAQFPLHVWLPDAMEGPTPVSAMIHAATMVAAGVFLLGRTYPLLSPQVLDLAAFVGGFTALFAACVACAQTRLKSVLAWSTISQLGFMVAAIGLGGVVAGLFHMVTHAFFKACLFLGAGSVIHANHHEQDLRRLGGLARPMRATFVCMLLAALALGGAPFFAGFYSKDAILQVAFERLDSGSRWVGGFASIVLPITAALTAFYVARLMFLTFGGTARERDVEPSGPAMTLPLVVLGLFCVVGGHVWLLSPADPFASDVQPWFARLVSLKSLYGTPPVGSIEGIATDQSRHIHSIAIATSLCASALGLALAWWRYSRGGARPIEDDANVSRPVAALRAGLGVDALYSTMLVEPARGLARGLSSFDRAAVDGAVDGAGLFARLVAKISAAFDRIVVDGAVGALGGFTAVIGSLVRLTQTGRIQQYAAFALVGAVAAAAWLILND